MEKEILQAIHELAVQMNEIEARQSKEMKGIRGEITGIKDEITGMKGEITGIKDEITGMKGEIAGIKDEITGMKGEITEIKGEITGMKGEMKEMEGRLNQKIEDEVKFLHTSMEMLIKSNHNNQVEIELLKSHVYK